VLIGKKEIYRLKLFQSSFVVLLFVACDFVVWQLLTFVKGHGLLEHLENIVPNDVLCNFWIKYHIMQC
jgi:uncharacterized membrane protein YqjE